MERVAERAAAESQEIKIVELLEGHVGETFSAMIAGVASYGLFVRLDNTAEGMVEIDDLGHEYFVLDPVRHTLTGSDTGKQYRLGKRIAVRLVEADHRTAPSASSSFSVPWGFPLARPGLATHPCYNALRTLTKQDRRCSHGADWIRHGGSEVRSRSWSPRHAKQWYCQINWQKELHWAARPCRIT